MSSLALVVAEVYGVWGIDRHFAPKERRSYLGEWRCRRAALHCRFLFCHRTRSFGPPARFDHVFYAFGGAVGSMVGMIAKHVFGCTVIGSAGGPEKCKLVTERFGFDYCLDYKAFAGRNTFVKDVLPTLPNPHAGVSAKA